MKKSLFCLCLSSFALSGFSAAFTPGDIVVSRAGDGSAGLTSAATAGFLDEYTPSGTLVQTIALPTSASGGNLAMTLSGTATSEGFLALSGNGQYLTMAGYNAAPGTASITTSAASAINRVVGLIGASGTVDTTTGINAGTSGNPRSVVTDNATQFWVASSSGGVGYVPYGGGSATQLSSTPSNTRVTKIFGGQLYVTSSSGTFFGIASIGSGTPTTSGQTTTLLPGFPTTTGPSSYDYFISGNNAWLADDRTSGVGGVQHWTLSGGTWSLSYTLATGATTGARGLTVDLSGANPAIFVTTTDNKIEEFLDTGATSTPTIVATGVANTAIRGIAFAPQAIPEPGSVFGLGAVMLLIGRKIFRRKQQ